MEVKRLRTLGSEIFKTLNKLNPAFIEEIFHRKKWLTYGRNNYRSNHPVVFCKKRCFLKFLKTHWNTPMPEPLY